VYISDFSKIMSETLHSARYFSNDKEIFWKSKRSRKEEITFQQCLPICPSTIYKNGNPKLTHI
jgi:hypothetical protein